MGSAVHDEQVQTSYAFGDFVLLPDRQLLMHGGSIVRMGNRAFELLTVLIQRAGELVTKRELIDRVWPNIFVEEGNLKVNIAVLRRALGEQAGSAEFIATVVGRGYRFVAPVRRGGTARSSGSGSEPPGEAAELSAASASSHVKTIQAALDLSRLVTLVGPGGIGKSVAARELARRDPDMVADRTVFIDVPQFPRATLLQAVADASHAMDGGGRALLVLDGCEAHVDVVARVVDELLVSLPDARVLATSREPIRVARERVIRLRPLALPVPEACLSASEALKFPGVALFVEHATRSFAEFVFDDAAVWTVVDICNRLDGLPLAIEIAASHVATIGIKALRSPLVQGLRGLAGLRSHEERHRSLRANYEWSHRLLSNAERRTWRRLAILPGPFSLGTACEVGNSFEPGSEGVISGLASLVAKSLIETEQQQSEHVFRYLNTARTFAIEKLEEAGEQDQARQILQSIQSRMPRPDAPHRIMGPLQPVEMSLVWMRSQSLGKRFTTLNRS